MTSHQVQRLSKSLRRLLWALALVGPLAGQTPEPSTDAGVPAEAERIDDGLFLWRIEGSVPNYIYGTIHVSEPRVSKIPPEVERALEKCDVLFAERPLDHEAKLEGLKLLIMDDLEPLRHRLTRETYEQLDAYMRSKGRSLAQIERLHLWAIALQITMMHGGRRPNAGPPQDAILWRLAGDMGLRRDGLESVEEQVAPFARLSEEQNQQFVQAALDAAAEIEASGTTPGSVLLELYLAGDEHALARHTDRFMPGNEALRAHLLEALVDVRNRRMALRIDDKVRTYSHVSHLFAVGASHLGGRDGIIERLRQRGVRMQRVLPGGAERPVEPYRAPRPMSDGGR